MNNNIPKPENLANEPIRVKPYMGHLTSAEIGQLASLGAFDSELAMKMAQDKNRYNNDRML